MKHNNHIIGFDLTTKQTKNENIKHAGKMYCKKCNKYIKWIGKKEKYFIISNKIHKTKITYKQYLELYKITHKK